MCNSIENPTWSGKKDVCKEEEVDGVKGIWDSGGENNCSAVYICVKLSKNQFNKNYRIHLNILRI